MSELSTDGLVNRAIDLSCALRLIAGGIRAGANSDDAATGLDAVIDSLTEVLEELDRRQE